MNTQPSNFETLAKKNALAAAQYGQSKTEKELTEIGFLSDNSSRAVQGYVNRLLELARNASTVADFQKIVPLINEAEAVAQKDEALKDEEKSMISELAGRLNLHIRKRTALFSRIGTTLKNVVRDRANDAREKVSDRLQGTDSILGQVAGKLMQRRERERSMFEKSILSARGELYQDAADAEKERAERAKRKERNRKEEEREEQDQKRKAPKAKRKPSASPESVSPSPVSLPTTPGGGFTGEAQTNLLMGIDAGVSELVRQGAEAAERQRLRDEQAERDADNARRQKTGVSPTIIRKKGDDDTSKTAKSWFDSLKDLFAKWGVGGLLGTLFSKLGSALTSLMNGVTNGLSKLFNVVKTGLSVGWEKLASLMGGSFGSAAIAGSVGAVVLAAEGLIANKLAGVFNELMDKYPALKRDNMTLKDDVKAFTDGKQNIAKVLTATQQGKILEPVGGFETPAEFNARRQQGGFMQDEYGRGIMAGGITREEYLKKPQYQRDFLEDEWRRKNPGADQTKAARPKPFKGMDNAATGDVRSGAGMLPSGLAAPSAPTIVNPTPTSPSIEPLTASEEVTVAAPPPAPSAQAPSANLTLPGMGLGAPAAPSTSPSKAKDMSMSEAGLRALRKREGLPRGQKEGGPYTAYWDKDGKVWTIGHGLTGSIDGKPIAEGLVISAAEEEAEIRRRLTKQYEPAVKQGLQGTPVTQDMFDALVSVAYNSPKAGKNLAKKVAAGQTLTADNFLASATVKNDDGESVRLKGLENRRMSEFQQAMGPSASRSAAPLMAAARDGRSTPATIVAPTIISAPQVNGGGQGTTYMPIPILAENRDSTLRGLRSVGGV